MVSLLQHSGDVHRLKWPSPQHHTIQKGGGAEAAWAGYRVAVGEHWTLLMIVCMPTHLGSILQVPRLNYYVLGR